MLSTWESTCLRTYLKTFYVLFLLFIYFLNYRKIENEKVTLPCLLVFPGEVFVVGGGEEENVTHANVSLGW